MRQQFAKMVIDFLVDGKRILNIDETWIGQTNFRRQKWQDPQRIVSEPLHPV
jgi:hypothetical protein